MEESLTLPEFSGQYLNPATWILAHAEESRIHSAQLAITHGDLHGDNMFVEEDHCWAIDFERTGRGHILRDFVELEEDIITRLYMLPGNNMYIFYNFLIPLTKPLSPPRTYYDTPLFRKRFGNEESAVCNRGTTINCIQNDRLSGYARVLLGTVAGFVF